MLITSDEELQRILRGRITTDGPADFGGDTEGREPAPEVSDSSSEEPSGSGRTEGTGNIPQMMREIIGKAGAEDSQSNAARAFDVSASQAHNFHNGETVHDRPSPVFRKRVEEYIDAAQELGAKKLLHALGVIGDDEIEAAPLKTKAEVASRLANIVNNIRPPKDSPVQIDRAVIFYRPQARKEEDYEVVAV